MRIFYVYKIFTLNKKELTVHFEFFTVDIVHKQT